MWFMNSATLAAQRPFNIVKKNSKLDVTGVEVKLFGWKYLVVFYL